MHLFVFFPRLLSSRLSERVRKPTRLHNGLVIFVFFKEGILCHRFVHVRVSVCVCM